MIGATLTGLDLFQSLTRTDRIEAATRRALEAEAAKLVDAIREAAPQDSGDLRDSVRQEPGDRPLSVTVTAGGTSGTDRGAGLDSALMTEFGTSHSEAEPFFYPTVVRLRDSIKANVDRVMDATTKDQ